MRDKVNGPIDQGFSTKGFSLSITYKGKTYAICDEQQWQTMRGSMRQKIITEMAREGMREEADKRKAALQSGNPPPPMEPTFSDDEVEIRVTEALEEAGYARQKDVLAKMTPEEREQWKISYRFTPFHTKPGAQR